MKRFLKFRFSSAYDGTRRIRNRLRGVWEASEMSIAVLYICTGRYTVFWKDFFTSCEALFLPGYKKHYFVFTDGDIPGNTNTAIVRRIEQQNLGWPGNTLDRFAMFVRIKEQLMEFDYIFFFNANCLFVRSIDESVLPSLEEGIMVVQHPGFYNVPPDELTYDRNPSSLACIPKGEGCYYVCGGINGGRAPDYLRLIDTLHNAVETDKLNNVMALWHDESHINKYVLTHPHKMLSPAYCYPEDWDLPFDPVIVVRDKAKFGGHNFLRGVPEHSGRNMIMRKILSTLRRIKRFVPIHMQAVSNCVSAGNDTELGSGEHFIHQPFGRKKTLIC